MENKTEYGKSTNLYLNCSSKYSSKELIIKFSYFLKPYLLQIVTAFFLMLISTCLQLPIPFISRYIIDKVILLKDINHFNIIIILIICVLVSCALSSFFEAYFLIKIRTKFLLDIRIRLFEHLQKLSINFFKQNKVGYLLSRMGDDVQSLNGLFADSLVSVIRSILTLTAGIICTMYLNPRLAFIACSLLPLYVVKIYLFNRHLRNMAWDLKERYAEVQ